MHVPLVCQLIEHVPWCLQNPYFRLNLIIIALAWDLESSSSPDMNIIQLCAIKLCLNIRKKLWKMPLGLIVRWFFALLLRFRWEKNAPSTSAGIMLLWHSFLLKSLTIYAPFIYTAPCVMLWIKFCVHWYPHSNSFFKRFFSHFISLLKT